MAARQGIARYLPSAVQSVIGVAALSAIMSGAAVQRRRRRAAGSAHQDGRSTTPWATSGSTGRQRDDEP